MLTSIILENNVIRSILKNVTENNEREIPNLYSHTT